MLRLILTPPALLPRSLGLKVFGALGLLAYRVLRTPREQILVNSRIVFPGWSVQERKRFTRSVFQAMGRNGFDFVRLHRYSEDAVRRLVAVRGLESLERARRQGAGVICLGAHLGCWELIPVWLRAAGFEVAVVYRRLRDPDLDAYVADRRRHFGIETYDRDTGGRGMLRSLRRGALLGILIDQRTRVDSVRVPFMGRDAWTPSGPVRLAMRLGAPMVCMLVAMQPGGTHLLTIGPEVAIQRARRDASKAEIDELVRENTARCNDDLSRMILECKEQWVWFHRRWDER